MGDVEPFIEWLRTRGTPEPHIAAHRHYAGELAKHPSLSAALRAEEEAGSPANRIANLRQTAARLAEFEDARSGKPVVVVAPPVIEPTPQARPPASARSRDLSPPRLGCGCRERQEIYLDNDFGAMASMMGGGVGIGTIFLIRFIGVIGALAIALGLAGLGGLVTILSVCFRCNGCRQTVRDLDADERSDLRKGRALIVLVTAGLLAGAAVCGFLWMSLVKTRLHEDRYGRDRVEVQQPAPESSETTESAPQ